MSCFRRALILALALCFGLLAQPGSPAFAGTKKSFKMAYSIYVGFMPLAYMAKAGTLKKWADKYGIEIELVLVNDYVGSINQFIAGDFDVVGVASMDGLTMPAAGGIDTSLLLITDYSNGNDVVLSKSAKSIPELKGQDVYLVEFSVSHYLLERALEMSGITEPGAVKTINMSDADISSAYLANSEILHAVSWKPMTADMLAGSKDSVAIFDSSKVPGEIMDIFVGKTETMKENPELAKAINGAWYETLATLKAGGPAADDMNQFMAATMGTDLTGLQAQLDTTHFFYTPAEAYAFLTDPKTKETWDLIRHFCFEQGLFGQGATSVDDLGIEMADGSVLGSSGNIKMRIDASVVKLGAEGKL